MTATTPVGSKPADSLDLAIMGPVPAKKRLIPYPKAAGPIPLQLPLNVQLAVSKEECSRLKAEVARLKRINEAQALEISSLCARFLTHDFVVDG